jgi:8-oxo-dGTP pyrophosphatase MutT (NUDIX family)
MIKNNNICNNCGKQGHLFHHCKQPITSYGVIVFRKMEKIKELEKLEKLEELEEKEYLMIRRKDSFGFVDFIRGKYIQHNIDQLKNIFNEMSSSERERIRTNNFDTLWRQMWHEVPTSIQFKNEESISQKKFDTLKNGLQIEVDNHCEILSLELLITESTTLWNETEWEFPKGRRNYQEKDLECALREFEEETGINKHDLTIIENVVPFEEIFIGSNHKSYKHKYFLAYLNKLPNQSSLCNFQKSEVSKIEWKTLEKCLESIRPYNLEKKQLIVNINKVLEEYKLY